MTNATRILVLATLITMPAMAASVVSRPHQQLRFTRSTEVMLPVAPRTTLPDNNGTFSAGQRTARTESFNGDSAYKTWWDIQSGPVMPKRVVNFGSGYASFMSIGSSGSGTPPAGLGAFYANNTGGRFQVYNATGATTPSPITSNSLYSSMGVLSDLSEIAVVQAGNPTSNPMVVMHDSINAPGGSWSTTSIPGSTNWYYPSLAVGANDKLHLVVSAQDADKNWSFLYLSSTDLGKTWSQPVALIDTIGVPGAYAVTANGNNVAVIFNFYGYFYMMQSVDNGGWFHGASFALNSQKVYSLWYRKTAGHDTTSLYVTDTVQMWGNAFDAVVDETGLLHVVAHPVWGYLDSVTIAGAFKGKHYHTTGLLSLLQGQVNIVDSVNGMFYFSVDTTQVVDFQRMGPAEGDPAGEWTSNDLQTYASINQTEVWIGHPQLSYNRQTKTLYCAYESYNRTDVEIYQGTAQIPVMYDHIYGTVLPPSSTWSQPVLLSREGNDAQYPSLADVADQNVVMTYQNDRHPGNYLPWTQVGQNPPFPATACALVGWVVPANTFLTGNAVNEKKTAPYGFELSQNYPNPFNPSTRIQYSLDRSAAVRLTVTDALGRTIATLANMRQAAGAYNVTFDASNLPSGVYTYTLAVDGIPFGRQMVLSK